MTRSDGLVLAFVLHRRDYGNTSLLVELFGQGVGRFPAIAKGAKRPRNTAAALLQPFQPVWIATAGRGEVVTLTRVEAAEPPVPLEGRSLLSGFYLNELLLRLLGRSDPHDEIFRDYQRLLPRLAADDFETLLRGFELRLLAALGYALALDVEADSGCPIVAERRYIVEPELGVVFAGDGPWSGCLSGATLLALARGAPLGQTQRREARDLLRRLIEPHLGGRPLGTRELYSRWFGARPSGTPSQPN